MGRRYLGRDHRSSARHTAWVAAAVLTCVLFFTLLHAHAYRPFLPLPLKRDSKPNSGDWLLLEQQGEWGDASLSVTCKRVSKMPDVPLVNPAGKLYDIVKVSIGDNCHTASN